MSAGDQDSGLQWIGKVAFADAGASALLKGRLDELSRPGQTGWEQIKHNASRTVYRNEIQGREVYLKHYHSRTIAHRLGRLLGYSDAKCEMQFSQYLAAHGVETPLALAAVCAEGAEWLATLGVAPAERGDQWHLRQLAGGREGRRETQKAIVALAEIVGQMHAVGVLHCDLHTGNLLVRTNTPEPRLVLMDLHRMTRKRRLSRRARAVNLAQLFHDRFDWTTRTERLRFLKHYLKASRPGGTLRGWQLMVEDFAWRHRRRLYNQRDRRIISDSRYFKRLKLPHRWRGHIVLASKRCMAGSVAAQATFQVDDWLEVLDSPRSLLAGDDVELVKDTRSGTVVRRKLTIGGHVIDVYVKSPRRKRAWKILLDCFRSARPIRSFRLGHALLTRRIATALPLAAFERRIGPLLLESILIVETVEGQQLNQFMDQWLSNPPKGDAPLTATQQHRLGQEVLWQMGRMLQRLHDNNFHHRDLKGPNMLVQWSPGQPPEIVLVDLDGLQRVRHLTTRKQFQGLMRLNVSLLRCPSVSHAGRLRMLLGYLRRPGSGRIHFKPYWRVLETWSARKLRKQIRSRRRKQKALRGDGQP